MNKIPLSTLPNQQLAFNLDGAYWHLHIYQAVSRMYMDISRNGVKLIDGVRCFGGIGLMPYKHLHLPSFGNFIFDSDADYTNFGNTCQLYYLTLEEYNQFIALGKADLIA